MDPEVLKDLYERATSQGYSKSIEEFTQLISSDQEVLDDNFDYVKTKGYSKDISEFSKLVGFGEKKNQVVTPSDGVEEVTESTTETETPLGSSDGLEVSDKFTEEVIEVEPIEDYKNKVKLYDEETSRLIEANPDATEDELYSLINREDAPSQEVYDAIEKDQDKKDKILQIKNSG